MNSYGSFESTCDETIFLDALPLEGYLKKQIPMTIIGYEKMWFMLRDSKLTWFKEGKDGKTWEPKGVLDFDKYIFTV